LRDVFKHESPVNMTYYLSCNDHILFTLRLPYWQNSFKPELSGIMTKDLCPLHSWRWRRHYLQ